MLALLASAVTYCTDRHQRAVQALATLHPKLWGLLFVQQVKRSDSKCKAGARGIAAAGTEEQQQEEQQRGSSSTGSPTDSLASSPGPLASPGMGEGPFSHRLEQLGQRRSDARRRRAASASSAAAGKGMAARWSMDAAPPLVHEAARRRQGTARLEFQLKPRTSVDFDVAAATTPRSSPECTAASALPADVRRQRRQPAMQRIASGEQLRELGCGGGCSVASASPPVSPSSWLPSSLSSWASLTLSTERLPTPESLVASISAASSAWVSRFVPSALERSASAPVEGAGAAAAAAAAHLTPAQRRDSIEHARRCSLEGASARHYCFGAIAAHPSRTAALAACAGAARGGSPGPAASALASLGLDGDCPQAIREHVTDEHLLQFGALIGEAPAAEASARLGVPGAWAAADALLGLPDTPRCHAGGWERCASGAHEGLTYEAERLPLRGGLYIYRSRAVVEGVEPRDVRPFQVRRAGGTRTGRMRGARVADD